jgi:hypothetical protein
MKKLLYVMASVAVMYSCTKEEIETPQNLNKFPQSELLQATKAKDTSSYKTAPEAQPTTTSEPETAPIEKDEIKPGDV